MRKHPGGARGEGGPLPRYTGAGTGNKDPNADGPKRQLGINIDVTVDADEAYAAKVDHCAKIVKNCLITASIFEGINVSHSVRRGGSAS